MSTVKSNIKNVKSHRLAQIAQLGISIFHTGDLASLWQIKNANTLHTTLKRYAKLGLLFRIQRGLYSIKPASELDPWLLGIRALHEYAYISAETILARAGIIFQSLDKITLISSHSKKFTLGGNNYQSRKLSDKFLFNSAGVRNRNGINMATPERAVADMLYFNSKAHFDAPNWINWREVKKIQKELGYPLISKRYDFT